MVEADCVLVKVTVWGDGVGAYETEVLTTTVVYVYELAGNVT